MKGFTLVELLVALVMLATLAGGLNLAFHTGLDANDRVHRRIDAAQEARVVLETLRGDIEQAALTPDSDRSWFIGEDENDGNNDHDTLRLITRSRRVPLRSLQQSDDWESQPHDADWSAITYSLNTEDSDTDPGLYRREQLPPGTDPFDEETGDAELLTDAVIGLNFRYFDGTDWLDAWDTTDANAGVMPSAVEVTVTFRPEPGSEEGRAVTAVFMVRALPPEAAADATSAAGDTSNNGGGEAQNETP